ncbi:MAG: RluA family pseudouridine synthase [Candidatus Paraimprobicoccus trichonymphae]|uniref:Pseudouridine synthase n=1 Tax=Candidatus Paraimprobicoccus trichonymphae TaxID=3033793 RepID=A0AA48HZN9_9FIRM|nr:MAG: RluA family pseudouridine synthase [Candidatus Paraimprobicoccus trichonymphae]
MKSENFKINENSKNQRIDIFVKNKLSDLLTRSYIHKLIRERFITVSSKNIKKNYILKYGDIVNVVIPSPKKLEILSEKIDLDIMYEDEWLLVVNKPKGMVVHPAPGNYDRTLVNALLSYCKGSLSGINGFLRPGIVHRLDKDTSGLLIVAKNDLAHKNLSDQIKLHNFKREYEAIVHGIFKNDFGTINFPIGRDRKNRKKMAVTNINSKKAVTHYQVIKKYDKFTYLKLILKTGRTHQIRVHMNHINHPVVGDLIYNQNKNRNFEFLAGQCLHAKTIGFLHPINKNYLEFKSELPGYFKSFLNLLKNT